MVSYSIIHPITGYTGLFSHPTVGYPVLPQPSSSSTGLFSVGRRKVCGGVGYRMYDGVH